jgi:hypothetical protein
MLKAALRLFAVALLLSLAACGPKNRQAPARVSGMVTYKGEALKAGSISFFSLDEKGQYNSTIGPDGTYEISDVPVGTYDVAVETESLNPGNKPPVYGGARGAQLAGQQAKAMGMGTASPNSPELAGRYKPIPKKYANRKTSGLSATLTGGRQTKSFDLTD